MVFNIYCSYYLIKVEFAAPSQNDRVNCYVLSYTPLVLNNFTVNRKIAAHQYARTY